MAIDRLNSNYTTFVDDPSFKKVGNVSNISAVPEKEPVLSEQITTADEDLSDVDLCNRLGEGDSSANMNLEIGEVQVKSEIQKTSPLVNKEKLKIELNADLNAYLSLVLQATALPEGEQKNDLLAKAKDLMKNYAAIKNSNPEIAGEMEKTERQIFKVDKNKNVLLGEIDSIEKLTGFFGVKEQTVLIKSGQNLLDGADKLESKIQTLMKKPQTLETSLDLQQLQLQKSIMLVQAKINFEKSNGKKDSDNDLNSLVDTRKELRESLTKSQLAIQLNSLQKGENPAKIIKNIENIGKQWFVQEDVESITQYRFALAQAKSKTGDYSSSVALYEQIKKSNPEQALNAQISIVSAENKTGIFSKVYDLEGKIGEIKQKQERAGKLREDLASGVHRTFTGAENLKKEEAELSQLERELKDLGTIDNVQRTINQLKLKQMTLLQGVDSASDTAQKTISKKMFSLEKSGKTNTQEYKDLKTELQNIVSQKSLTKASIYEKQGNHTSAAKEYENLLKTGLVQEGKNEILLKISANYLASKSFDNALKAVSEAKENARKSGNTTGISQALMMEASVYLKRNDGSDLQKAKDTYSQAINLLSGVKSPDAEFLVAGAKLEKARILYSEGNFNEGDKLTNDVASKNKMLRNSALFMQGNAYLQDDQPTKAFSAFDKILTESPGSAEASSIKKELTPFIVNDRLQADKVNTKSDVWSAAQVALKVSGSNHIVTSLALAAGGAAAGAAIGAGIGVWVGGAGAVPGALIGLAVGTIIDRTSALVSNWDKVDQTYKTGYENVSTMENAINLVGLGLDVLDVVPVVGALGKTGKMALKQALKTGSKELGSEMLEDVVSKTGRESVSGIEKQMSKMMIQSRDLTRTFLEDVDKMGKVFTDPKLIKTQMAIGGGLILTPAAVQVISSYEDYRNNKIDGDELKKRLEGVGENTLKAAGSVIVMGMVMGKVQNMSSKLDNLTKGMSKELNGPVSMEQPKIKMQEPEVKAKVSGKLDITSTKPEEIKKHVISVIDDMISQPDSVYSSYKKDNLKEIQNAIETGKISINENTNIIAFAQVKNKEGKISIEVNPKLLGQDFVDKAYLSHEIIHVLQPMKNFPNNMREGFTEYVARRLFPRNDAPSLDYDKFVKATDALLEGLVKRGGQKEIFGKLLGQNYDKVTLKDIEANPKLKEEVKLKLAQMLMDWSTSAFKDRLYSWFGLEVNELPILFDKLTEKYGK